MGVPSPPNVPLAKANQGLAAARRRRAEWTVGVANGMLTPLDVIVAAESNRADPLRRVRLRQLLMAQAGWGEIKADAGLRRLVEVSGANVADVKKLTVGWLVHPHSRRRRLMCWLDVFEVTRDQPPWEGFPFTPDPSPARDDDPVVKVAPAKRRGTGEV